MVCAIHKGSYESIATTYHVIMKWIEEYITEIQIPVTKE